MKTYKVTVASTIYYQARIDAENEQEIEKLFNEMGLDFTDWEEVELQSDIYDITEV